jgi:hypothetical protein
LSTNELVIYQSNNLSTHIDVLLEDETVWLTQLQMADLFQTTRNNITLHIGNIFKEHELETNSVSKDFLLTASDGKKYKTKLYNLDVIISVGYRVKSKTGTQFRIWATNTLKTYLLKGYIIQDRIESIEKKLYEHDSKIKLLLNTNLPPNQGIFYDGEIFDAYVFETKLIKSAKKSIVLIDNYCDETVLTLLSKRHPKVKASIYLNKIEQAFQLDIEKHNLQYSGINVHLFKKAHDRFLILDEKEVYHIGASLKDLGNKWFAFSKLNIDSKEIISKLTSPLTLPAGRQAQPQP